MNEITKEYLREYILVISGIITYLVVIFCTTRSYPDLQMGDNLLYYKMAENPINAFNGTVGAPQCYRILMPFLAWLLPFDLTINFLIITVFSLFFIGIILYEIFKDYFSKVLAFTGVTLFYCFQWTSRFFIYIYNVDSLAFVFIILCFWAINKSNLKYFTIILCIGVLTKEIVLFTIPVLIISEYLKMEVKNPIQKKYIIKCIRAILPGIIIFATLRLINTLYSNRIYDYFEVLQTTGFENIKSGMTNPRFVYLCTIAIWGLICCIFPLFNSRSKLIDWIKLYGIFICLIYCQILLATDILRILVAGFFPIILLTLSGMENLSKKKRINELIFLCLTIIYFVKQIITGFNDIVYIIYYWPT